MKRSLIILSLTMSGVASAAADIVALPADTLPTDTARNVPAGTPAPKRGITPIDIDDKKPPVVLHYYDKHGNPLENPVRFLATLDTVTQPKAKPVFPIFNGITVGVNIADAITRLAGQKHSSFDVSVDASILNWFFPVAEAGIGFARFNPVNTNYTYTAQPSFYTKVGLNYNPLYKSDAAYQFFVGGRFGVSNYRYGFVDFQPKNGVTEPNITGLRATSTYWEMLAGLRVRIVDSFSLGWTARYHALIKTYAANERQPQYIPGYGIDNPALFTFSAFYIFGEKQRKPDSTPETK